VDTQRHRAVYDRRPSSGSLVALTPQGHRQHFRLGSLFPPGRHSLRCGEGDPVIGLVGSEDWTGYEQVGALPIQLGGTDFTPMAMDVPSHVLEQVAEGEVTATEEDEVKEIVASGGPLEQLLPPGRSPRGKGVSPARPRLPSGQVLEERSIPRSAVPAFPPSTTGVHNINNPWRSGQTPEGFEWEQPRSAPRYLERAEWEKNDDLERERASGSRIKMI
jgi:hypothetical protein